MTAASVAVVAVCLSLSLIGVGFHYTLKQSRQNWIHFKEGTCIMLEEVRTEHRLCEWQAEACNFQIATYALHNGLGLTHYHLQISRYKSIDRPRSRWSHWFDPITSSESKCQGTTECQCYYDNRNVQDTLAFDRKFYWSDIVLMSLFLLAVSIPFLAYEYLF